MFSFHGSNKIALEIVKTAILRSHPVFSSDDPEIFIFISPDEHEDKHIQKLLGENKKVIVFGKISDALAAILGLEIDYSKIIEQKKAIVCLDQQQSHNTSEYYLGYQDHQLTANVPYEKRYFARFDFMDEWNNHGYGRIGVDGDIWSINQCMKTTTAVSLADAYDELGYVSVMVCVRDFDIASVLHINREVGFVDGLDWTIIENFITRYRHDVLPSAPLMHDMPYGIQAVASPRLDCDQSVISTKPLVDLYKSNSITLSLAISTGIGLCEEEISYLNGYYSNDGALLSHTVNHFFDWGDCYSTVFNEAKGSKEWLESNVTNLESLHYAISPFHTNKPYSIEALADAGYRGFISGIIHNDPEYLMAVSGQVPFTTKNIVSHSQQCMLHGDCFHRSGNSIAQYTEAFDLYHKAGKMFGYLDHPFGSYDYGWESEEERLHAHQELIDHINLHSDVIWMTSTEVLDFAYAKSQIRIEMDAEGKLNIHKQSPSKYTMAIEYREEINGH